MADFVVRVEFDEAKFLGLINKFKEENHDFIEVVRCKDCVNYREDIAWCNVHSHFIDSNGNFCYPFIDSNGNFYYPYESSEWKMFDPEYFCTDGKRKDGTNE